MNLECEVPPGSSLVAIHGLAGNILLSGQRLHLVINVLNSITHTLSINEAQPREHFDMMNRLEQHSNTKFSLKNKAETS